MPATALTKNTLQSHIFGTPTYFPPGPHNFLLTPMSEAVTMGCTQLSTCALSWPGTHNNGHNLLSNEQRLPHYLQDFYFPNNSTILNLLKPNDIYICRTAALTSRRYILNIYSTNIHTEYFKHAA